ncbi:MAG: hypothetical protein EWV52_09320 [Microcystis panniformis Mp_MB_F_20051200_S6D]|nr:MAG: hypothetical protein EWV42_23340 [Microcystis panniformis Mp_GB_SS_20050300_S99D]TRV51164.1 MAG: hypothetical protein EWV87_07005 [Microcystis panniformis Mp_GB_SS_20050300_S99]TRV52641.1 MAG: hypothetical protein EWV43_01675 [Microcystis panniformis Mp_MB_F_20080800_S26D]TRV58494.1 MAG: hypothetical protein EWV86_19245 [Microcystis panniformis Mp_MB_F_20051200_S9D]TRV73685.1 MAG: hypothetical protein EWV52_09320 [Microcystis panniformis Mp_MB_F_20051200_S6D]
MMIMFIKISQLIAIGLLLLVGCSAEPSNKNESDSKNTGVVESDISGCWERSQFTSYANGGSSYWKETYKLEPGGSYSRESVVKITPVVIRPVEPHYSSGEWIIDDGYVVIQWKDGNKVTLKVISKYELIQVGDSIAFRRC